MADHAEEYPQAPQRLERDFIADTSACQLLLRISADELYVMIYNPHVDNSLITASIPLADTLLNCLEEAVYDNPLLLRDFARVDVMFDSSAYMLLPTSVAEEDVIGLLSTALPDAPKNVIEDTLTPSIKLAYCLDAALEGFVRRTFFNARLHHRLTPLIQYFTRGLKRNATRIYVNIKAASIDIVAVDHSQLLLANTFNKATVEDAVYYIISVRDMLFHQQLSRGETVEIVLAGASALRAAIAPLLGRYAPPVSPVIFPSAMFHAGGAAMDAPFELTVTSLCE